MSVEEVIDGQRAVRTASPSDVTVKNDKLAYAVVDGQECLVVTNVGSGSDVSLEDIASEGKNVYFSQGQTGVGNYEINGTSVVVSGSGVATNFVNTATDGSFLSINNFVNEESSLSSFEFTMPFVYGSGSQILLYALGGTYSPFAVYLLEDKLTATVFTEDSSGSSFTLTGTTDLVVGAKYWAKFSYDASTGYALKLSTNGLAYNDVQTNSTTDRPFVASENDSIYLFGRYTTNTSLTFRGSAYLSETNLYINGSLAWTAWESVSDGKTAINASPSSQIYVLDADNWSSNTYVLSVTGLGEDSIVFVGPKASADNSNEELYTSNGIRATSQGEGTLTFSAITVPTDDVLVVVTYFA